MKRNDALYDYAKRFSFGEAVVARRTLRVRASLLLAGLGFLLVLVYIPIGHRLVRAVYDVDLPLAHQLMSHKAETPLQDYLHAADMVVLKTSTVLVLGAVGLLASRNLLGFALSAITVLAGSLVVFVVLDVALPLANALHFDVIPYFDFRLNQIPDAELIFLEKPFRHVVDHNWRGGGYSPSYGIDVPASVNVWETDEEGFRNPPGRSSADVVVLGSSFPPFGINLEDTYSRKLERHLNGYTVANLAKGGYGPNEALKVFRRFGLPKKPKYAILAFHTADVETFLGPYAMGKEAPTAIFAKAAFGGGFWSRWWLVLDETQRMLAAGFVGTFHGIADSVTNGPKEIHPDVAVLRLPGNIKKDIVFLAHHTGLPATELLSSAPWRIFEKILRDFKQISEQNQVIPLVAYIPCETEVYAKYSTPESGRNWLAVRESQVATSANDEEAARRLAESVGIELVSFLPAFEDAARNGKLVYYQLDGHWNSEGSEIAARVTSEALQAQVRAARRASQQRAAAIENPNGSDGR